MGAGKTAISNRQKKAKRAESRRLKPFKPGSALDADRPNKFVDEVPEGRTPPVFAQMDAAYATETPPKPARDLSKVRAAGLRRRLRGLLVDLEELQRDAAEAATQIEGLGAGLVVLKRAADAFEAKAKGPQVVEGASVRFASPEAAREHGAPKWFPEDAIGRVVSVTESRAKARLTKLAAVLFPTAGIIQAEQRIIVRVGALVALTEQEAAEAAKQDSETEETES